MGKYDHIPELTGADNYITWETQVRMALTNEDLWRHVSDSTDSKDLLGCASHLPAAADPSNPTADESKKMREWLINDSQAKTIILRRLGTCARKLIPRSSDTTARAIWQIFRSHYHRIDISTQFVLRRRIQSLRMKDSADADRYVGDHIECRDRLLEMGAVYSDAEAIFQLLTGLPTTSDWQLFRAQQEQALHNSQAPSVIRSVLADGTAVSTTIQSASITFDSCAAHISSEATRLLNERLVVSGPGSEYAHSAVSGRRDGGTATAVNPITGLRKNKSNPQGIYCLTPGCGRGDHDHEHCYREGGGMAGQAPWQKKKKGASESTAAAAAEPLPPPSSAPALPAGSSAVAALAFMGDLSCVTIEESPDPVLNVSRVLSTILDSGTTSTLIADRSFFWSYSSQNAVTVRTANQGSLPTAGRGDCVAWLSLGGRRHRVRLSNCLHAPGAMFNLLSVGWMLSKGWECNFRSGPARCELVYRGAPLGAIPMFNNLFTVALEFIPPQAESPCLFPSPELAAFAHVPITLDLWHARMGHPGGQSVRRLPTFASGVTLDPSQSLSRCESCVMGKHPQKPFPSSSEPRASQFLALVHSDVCGPLPVQTPHGKRYFIIFLDDHTNLLDIQLLSSKDQALDAWRLVRARWENMSGKRVQVFRSDNGGEFLNGAFSADLAAAGIARQLSAPYAHQQNGKAERVIRTIEGRMYAMLDFAHLPRTLWGEAALTAGYLFNRSESRALPPGKTPYEMLHGQQPDLSHLRVFGSRCFTRISLELQEKLGPRSCEAYFMGYPPGVKAWRCRDKLTGAFFNSRDVIFDENFTGRAFPDGDDDSDEDDPPHTPAPSPVALPPAPPVPAPPSTALLPAPAQVPGGGVVRRSGRTHDPTERGRLWRERVALDKARLEHQRGLRAQRAPTVAADDPPPAAAPPPDSDTLGFPPVLANLVISELACLSTRSDTRRNPLLPSYDLRIPPATYSEALLRPDRDQWLGAMKKEINLMSEMGVYELVSLPAGRKAIGCRWVLEFKEDMKGGSVFKARLVAQGFSQVSGVDFGKTFAPVARASSIRALSAYAAAHDWELDSFDAKRAFLWGKLHEDVYMRQPPGFEQLGSDGAALVCHLLSSLYGLKQAAYDWYELLREVLGSLGFSRCDADYAVFVYTRAVDGAQTTCIIAWHVDDGLAAANNRTFLDWVKGQIGARFGIADLGPVTKYLGIQFERDRKTRELWMHQREYISFLLDEHGLSECNPVSLPMDPVFPFGRDADTVPHIDNLQSEYRKLVGELLYLAMYTRPDIALAVMRLAQHNSAPESRHYAAAKRVLRYLAGSIDLCVHYGSTDTSPTLHGYSDSDWATCPEDRVSITGYVWFFNGGPVSHSAKKQTTHALSSTEAEYMALTAAIQDSLWLKSFFACLQIPIAFPLRLFADNVGAIALSTEAVNHARTKHIDLRYHFIREHVDSGTFSPVWISTHKNTADIFTKPLSRPIFLHHRTGLSLVSR